MRILKLGLISAIFFGLLITGISLFIPSHVVISKAINIGVSREHIDSQLINIEKWKQWYPGFDTLPLKPTRQTDGRWTAAAINNIAIQLTNQTDSMVTAEFSSNGKRPIINNWRMVTYGHTDSVTVQWSMNFKMKWYPWEKFSSLILESRYAPQMEKGLANLKVLLEK